MGATESRPQQTELWDTLCRDAKNVFEERLIKELRETPDPYAPSIWADDIGVYIRQTVDMPFTLVVSSQDNRASDVALDAAFNFIARKMPQDTIPCRCILASSVDVKNYEARRQSWSHKWSMDPEKCIPTCVNFC
jgi:hypothetical protein